jgi:prepilin-type N-terminal cleavage/methylation domain-containing protein
MIYRRLRLYFKDQRGFTILEMLVSVALTALISLGASMASIQVLNQTARNTDYTTASRQAMNAIHWISQDAQMAQVTLGADTFPDTGDLVFTWTTWENEVDTVVYSVSGGELRRQYSVSGGEPVETVIAGYINPDPDLTGCVLDDGVLSLKVTASVGEGDTVVDVTRTRDIISRPNL